jgi:hypothetical protein
MGRKGETFDDILTKMLNAKKKKKRMYPPEADPAK